MWLHMTKRLSTSGEMSLWEELWAYFSEHYFSVDTGQYTHLNLSTSSIVTLRGIILGIFAGIVLAAAIVCYDKNRLGAFVRKIIREECLWPDRAKTLSELGFEKNGSVKASLRSKNHLGRIVRCVEREAYEREVEAARAAYIEKNGSESDFFMPPYRIDFQNDHFYIPDEEHYTADIRYENKGSGLRAFILVLIGAVVGAALVCFLLPDMLQMVDNLMDILSADDNVLR